MKILSFCLLISLALSSFSANVFLAEADMSNNKKLIDYDGMFDEGMDRSINKQPFPFTIYLVDNSLLTITSEARVLNITASIIKDGVTVEQAFFSIGKDETETIYLYDLAPGEYTLLLTTPSGTHLEGLFHL